MAWTAGITPSPRREARTAKPSASSRDFQLSGSAPAMSFRAWSPATSISGTRWTVFPLRALSCASTSPKAGQPSTVPTSTSVRPARRNAVCKAGYTKSAAWSVPWPNSTKVSPFC